MSSNNRISSVLLPLFLLILSGFTLMSCKEIRTEYQIPEFPPTSVFDFITDMTPAYAKGFKVTYMDDGTALVDIPLPSLNEKSSPDMFKMALVRTNTSPDIPEEYIPIYVPIHSAICTDTRQISYFIGLDSLSIIKGITGSKEDHTTDIVNMLTSGNIQLIGTKDALDIPKINDINPDVVFVTPTHVNNEHLNDIRAIKIPVLCEAETHPLAQAEWIKLFAMLIGKEEYGSDFFGKMEQNYNEAKVSTLEVVRHPMVLPCIFDGNEWEYLGKDTIHSLLINDAGAMLPSGIPGTFINLHDLISRKGYQVDFLQIMCADAVTKEQSNALPSNIQRIFYLGGKEQFKETVTTAPDAFLKDLISIIHPEVIPKDSIWKHQFLNEAR